MHVGDIVVVGVGFRDLNQDTHAIRKNYPVLGNVRYLFEYIRPEIQQYFIEDDNNGAPFSRAKRNIVYRLQPHCAPGRNPAANTSV